MNYEQLLIQQIARREKRIAELEAENAELRKREGNRVILVDKIPKRGE